ncbi:glycoside hydrolase family 3 C-terminal domain-containing protein [Myceligenerans crystallogenes]|uniref:Glycoside hydrolase family 3 C-terminal domain-containing protein n=1 Tax=Myceligenerans crystallogenes TaxID=316335 RepID=A0ABN2NCN6_9MICO
MPTSPQFRDPRRPLTDRARALLVQLTPEERLSLLHQRQPAIDRLGLAEFHTGNEALHGQAWQGTATVFPQPVGMGATWDADLIRRIGDVVATEVRAKHAGDSDISLNVWAPVVNPLRHPAWGRTEEGYSEEPWLVAALGTAYCRGLRGDHARVWKTVPTLKHFLGYGNETDRSATSSNLDPRSLHEYELPCYTGPVAAGVAGAVMPSYNRVNGVPAHTSAELISLLRDAAPGSLAFVSDAGAPTFLVTVQREFATHAEGHAAMLRAGVDSFTDNDADASISLGRLREALEQGLLTQEDVDRAALRLLELRLRTGELDGDGGEDGSGAVARGAVVSDDGASGDGASGDGASGDGMVGDGMVGDDVDPYGGIGPEAIDLPEHRVLAREAAARSVVLLANDGLLPLTGEPRRIAVVGPHADQVCTDWYSGTLPYRVTLSDAVRERWLGATVDVVPGADRVALRTLDTDAWVCVDPDGTVTARGPEPAQRALESLAAATSSDTHELETPADTPSDVPPTDTWLDVTDWGEGLLTIRAAASGKLLTGAGWIVRADAERVGGWIVQESFRRVATGGGWALQHVGSGRWLHVQRDIGGIVTEATRPEDATVFAWEVIRSGADDVARAAAGADAVLVTVGNDPHLLGRETEDRPSLLLPEPMRNLWRAARDANDASVLVVVSSYPYVLTEDCADARAVVWSSHGGQELGHGLVDVLSGDTEPYGRLAQTWPSSEAQAGDLFDYDVRRAGQTYRWLRDEPTFWFGHGLTYGRVEYFGLEVADDAAGADAPSATVTVRNDGDRPADELVQLYSLGLPGAPIETPRRLLLGHTRVRLAPGETRAVVVPLETDRLAVWDDAARALRVQPGGYTLAAGPSAGTAALQAVVAVGG